MAITYESNLSSGGSGGGSIKDAYRSKVFGDTTGLTVGDITGYNNRAKVNEGRWAVDTTNKTVWLYADFTILASQYSQDYWAQITLVDYSTSYNPRGRNTTKLDTALTTDNSSDIPDMGFFKLYDNINISVTYPKSHLLRQGQNYIIYGSWTYGGG